MVLTFFDEKDEKVAGNIEQFTLVVNSQFAEFQFVESRFWGQE